MNYEKYLTVTMSAGTLSNFIWDGNGNFTAAGNVTALLDNPTPCCSCPEVPALLSHLSDKA